MVIHLMLIRIINLIITTYNGMQASQFNRWGLITKLIWLIIGNRFFKMILWAITKILRIKRLLQEEFRINPPCIHQLAIIRSSMNSSTSISRHLKNQASNTMFNLIPLNSNRSNSRSIDRYPGKCQLTSINRINY